MLRSEPIRPTDLAPYLLGDHSRKLVENLSELNDCTLHLPYGVSAGLLVPLFWPRRHHRLAEGGAPLPSRCSGRLRSYATQIESRSEAELEQPAPPRLGAKR